MQKLINAIHIRYAHVTDERGYTLLEYCIGAAAIGALIWGAMQALDTGVNTYFTNLGAWFSGQNNPDGS